MADFIESTRFSSVKFSYVIPNAASKNVNELFIAMKINR